MVTENREMTTQDPAAASGGRRPGRPLAEDQARFWPGWPNMIC
jgi:hypothetical protein